MVELHDCFSCNELITYEALGLCEEGVCCVHVCTTVCLYFSEVCEYVYSECVSMCTCSECVFLIKFLHCCCSMVLLYLLSLHVL